jgi:hypothetical protein
MAEPMTGDASVTRCPWCSATLESTDVANCPSCGATLSGSREAPSDLPGVTTLDTEALLRARSGPRRPNRLVSLLTGETGDDSAPASATPDSLAPPSEAVRREMLRMALEAEVADLEAEVNSINAEEALEASAAHRLTDADVAAAARAGIVVPPDEAALAPREAPLDAREPADDPPSPTASTASATPTGTDAAS